MENLESMANNLAQLIMPPRLTRMTNLATTYKRGVLDFRYPGKWMKYNVL